MDKRKEPHMSARQYTLPFSPLRFVPSTGIVEDQTGCRFTGQDISKFYSTLVPKPSDHILAKPGSLSQCEKPRLSNAARSCKQKKWQPFPGGKADGDIFRLAQEGDVNGVVRKISGGCDVNVRDAYGWTPLMCASCSGAVATVEVLLAHGADRNASDPQGRNALYFATKNGHHRVVAVLSKSKEPPLAPNVSEVFANPSGSLAYCRICNSNYTESMAQHNSSIVHLFNLSRHSKRTVMYEIPETNRGYQMMLKRGWDRNKGLGVDGSGEMHPVKTVLKRNRHGLGTKSERKPRVTHFRPGDEAAVKFLRVRSSGRTAAVWRLLTRWEKEREDRKHRLMEVEFRRAFNEPEG